MRYVDWNTLLRARRFSRPANAEMVRRLDVAIAKYSAMIERVNERYAARPEVRDQLVANIRSLRACRMELRKRWAAVSHTMLSPDQLLLVERFVNTATLLYVWRALPGGAARMCARVAADIETVGRVITKTLDALEAGMLTRDACHGGLLVMLQYEERRDALRHLLSRIRAA